jgi:hypothetical protein
MHEAVADHFVLALEAFAAFGAETAGDGAVVWTVLGMHVCVGTIRLISDYVQSIACSDRGLTSVDTASEKAAHYIQNTRIGTR